MGIVIGILVVVVGLVVIRGIQLFLYQGSVEKILDDL